MQAEIRKRGRGRRRVVELRPQPARAARVGAAPALLHGQRAEAHRARAVDEHHHIEVRLLHIALHIHLVGAREHLPVDLADAVAGRVLAVLGELDREALVRRAVHAAHHALDDHARAKLERRELTERLGREVLLGAKRPLVRPFTRTAIVHVAVRIQSLMAPGGDRRHGLRIPRLGNSTAYELHGLRVHIPPAVLSARRSRNRARRFCHARSRG